MSDNVVATSIATMYAFFSASPEQAATADGTCIAPLTFIQGFFWRVGQLLVTLSPIVANIVYRRKKKITSWKELDKKANKYEVVKDHLMFFAEEEQAVSAQTHNAAELDDIFSEMIKDAKTIKTELADYREMRLKLEVLVEIAAKEKNYRHATKLHDRAEAMKKQESISASKLTLKEEEKRKHQALLDESGRLKIHQIVRTPSKSCIGQIQYGVSHPAQGDNFSPFTLVSGFSSSIALSLIARAQIEILEYRDELQIVRFRNGWIRMFTVDADGATYQNLESFSDTKILDQKIIAQQAFMKVLMFFYFPCLFWGTIAMDAAGRLFVACLQSTKEILQLFLKRYT